MSNWCMGCGREIPDGDYCPSCRMASYSRERDSYVCFEESVRNTLARLMDEQRVTTTLPGALRREIRMLNIMHQALEDAARECRLRMSCNEDILDKMDEESKNEF